MLLILHLISFLMTAPVGFDSKASLAKLLSGNSGGPAEFLARVRRAEFENCAGTLMIGRVSHRFGFFHLVILNVGIVTSGARRECERVRGGRRGPPCGRECGAELESFLEARAEEGDVGWGPDGSVQA